MSFLVSKRSSVRARHGALIWLGGVMVASTVWDGRASVRFRAEPLGDIAQLVERCPSKAKAGGSTPLIPTVVGPDIKMAPASLAQW